MNCAPKEQGAALLHNRIELRTLRHEQVDGMLSHHGGVSYKMVAQVRACHNNLRVNPSGALIAGISLPYRSIEKGERNEGGRFVSKGSGTSHDE